MKVGYKRLLIFIFCIAIFLFINAFFINFLSGYKMVIFLSFILLFFAFYFVIEKDKHRYFKDILYEIILFVLTYFMLFYLLGFIVGLTKMPNYFSINAIFTIIVPIILYCILREIFRYNMLCKADGSKICTVCVVILLILFDITNSYYYANFNSQYDVLKFIALSLLPAISKNISYSYISKKMGYLPVIIFDLIFVLYPYFIPIQPNPSEYVMSVIYLIVPVLFAFRILKFFDMKKDDMIPSNYHKKKFKGIILPIVIILIMVYFYSGYFKYYAIAVASGSMSPAVNKGDVVIVNQKYKKYKVDDVIAFRQDNKIIIHRINKRIRYKNTYLYYTKGDSNKKIDDFIVENKMIIGKVSSKIPAIGYPTVWFNKK